MTTRLLLVRHGATILSAEDRFAGSTDVDLSEEGRDQARGLAERLAQKPLSAAFASPMKRTIETASIVGAPHGLTPVPVDGLREIDHGRWEGMWRSEVEAQFPEEYVGWEADPFTFAPEGGEAGLNVLVRALPVIRRIVVDHPDATVLVVSHMATIRLLISSLLGFDAGGYRDRLDQHPCCLNILDFKDPVRARLMLFNDVSHYEGVPSRLLSSRLSKWWDPAPATTLTALGSGRHPLASRTSPYEWQRAWALFKFQWGRSASAHNASTKPASWSLPMPRRKA